MTSTERSDRTAVVVLACAAALAVLIANTSGIATGDDGVGYRAIADSLLGGDGYAYFLEDPVTIWPPVWPALMALAAWLTPLDTMGAAIALNALVAAGVVLSGNHLLRLVLTDRRLVMAGTFVLALGPATIGLGHVLMTDMAFALVTLWWMSTLIRSKRDGGSTGALVAAALLVWLGFGLRYVGLVLIPIGGLWLVVGPARNWLRRIRDAVVYALIASVVPLAWMLRNHAIDGTFTGERNPSARGLIDNCMDVAATLGRFILPGLGNGFVKIWAGVGIVVALAAAAAAWKVLRSTPGPILPRIWSIAATPLGLVLLFAGVYLLYMLYVRTTTALNQLDTRLLFPAYLPLVVCALALLERIGAPGALIARAWAAANVALGLAGMVAFVAGNPYFVGNYESDVFQQVRRNPAIAALPAGCTLYSNLPNSLYPAYESLWSPRRTALESTRRIDDLEQITATLDTTPSCLVWIDEPPTYGHLFTLEQLGERLELVPVASDRTVSTYLMRSR